MKIILYLFRIKMKNYLIASEKVNRFDSSLFVSLFDGDRI